MITKWNETRGKTAIFIGSSVCVGSGATDNRGWSTMVAERMVRNGWTTSNCAIGDGVIDFNRVIPAAIAVGAEYLVIEQKTDTPYPEIKKSYLACKSMQDSKE